MPDSMDAPDLSAEVAALSQRMTAVEAGLRKAVSDFTPIGGRVTELSAAFLDANTRLAAAETAIEQIRVEEPPPAEERMLAMEQALSTLGERVGGIEQARMRGGRLSQRLADIEARLPQDPPTDEGGTDDPDEA